MLNNEMLDWINVISFLIGVMNLKENLTQGDKQELMQQLENATKTVLDKAEQHLSYQDKKIDEILSLLRG